MAPRFSVPRITDILLSSLPQALLPPHARPLPIALNDVADELEDNRNKGDEGEVQVATNKTSQAKRKTGCKIDSAGCDEL